MAGGSALIASSPAHATCDNHDPTTGQTTTCSPPIPDTTRVGAADGSTNVTVNVLPGAAINVVNINGIFVHDQSRITNAGTITVSGNTFDGITSDLTGNNNTLINRGMITTTGAFSEGIFTTGAGSALLNDNGGTIITQGSDSPGLHSFGGSGGNNTLTNAGVITTSGDRSSGMQAINFGNLLTNNGTITTTGADAHGLFGNGNNNTLINNGIINVSGANAHGITALGTTLGPITNTGSMTASGMGGLGAFIESATTFTNAASGTIVSKQATGIIANGGGTFNNAGTITAQNIGININGGSGNVTNTGTITGAVGAGLLFAGNFNNSLFNSGNINGNGTAVQFDTGNDQFTMADGTVRGIVNMGDGTNTVTMTSGRFMPSLLGIQLRGSHRRGS
jgi:hypothetical protein